MKRILFADKDDWHKPVRARLDARRFEPHFHDFQDAMLDFWDFDAIVPLRLSDYVPMRMRPSPNMLIPDDRTVQVMHDKMRFNEFLARHGFGELVPEVYGERIEYPFIYKKRHDQAGINSKVIRTAEECAAFEAGIVASEYYKQRYVGGRSEYTTHALCVDGRIVFDASVKFGFDDEHYVRGVKFEARRELIPSPHLGLFQSITEALGYTGTCCFNYKLEGEKPLIFEVNPRAGGSLRQYLNPYLDAYLAASAGRG